jgi:hypothetical protein
MAKHTCPFCQCDDPQAVKKFVPPEPPVGTWVKDRHGGTSYHQTPGGWGQPGIMPFGRWEAMWLARGPLEVCGPWGADLLEETCPWCGGEPGQPPRMRDMGVMCANSLYHPKEVAKP